MRVSGDSVAQLEQRLAELIRIRHDYSDDEAVPGFAVSLDYLIAETTRLIASMREPRVVHS